MCLYRRPSLGVSGVLLSAAGLLLATESSGRAEIDAEIFAGAHFFSGENRLSLLEPQTAGSTLRHGGLFGLRLGYLPIPRLAIEGELAMIPTGTQDDLSRLGVLSARGHLLLNILTGRLRPFLLVGGGALISTPTISSPLRAGVAGALHAGAGLKLDFAQGWGLRIEGRLLLPQAIQQPLTTEGEVLLGLYGRFDVKAPPKPLPPPEPAPVLAPPPEVAPPPAVAPPPVAEVPAPMQPPADSDQDGLSDAEDRCPSALGPRENGGCPDSDSDGDGVVDRLDRCPQQGETKNGFEDEDGCPDTLPAAVAQFSGRIEGVAFEPNQAVLTPGSLPILDRAVAMLREHAGIRIEIAGHSDNLGPADKNRALSQARAEAVRAYLIEKGIDGGRLTAAGYGPDKPLESNATPQGRAKNRRVEFALKPAP
jgi:outer membrane protein OmpA-like peptidoglycan-associated protein